MAVAEAGRFSAVSLLEKGGDNPMIDTLTVFLVVFASMGFVVSLITLVVLIIDHMKDKK
jgi:hypothetical protein